MILAHTLISRCSSVLAGVFLVALLWLGMTHSPTVALLFFPSAPRDSLGAEWRRLPPSQDEEERLTLLVKEVFLGPREIRLHRLFPVLQTVNAVALDGPQAYIDLNGLLLVRPTERNYPLSLQLDYLRRNIEANFPKVDRVTITIDGQLPGPRAD